MTPAKDTRETTASLWKRRHEHELMTAALRIRTSAPSFAGAPRHERWFVRHTHDVGAPVIPHASASAPAHQRSPAPRTSPEGIRSSLDAAVHDDDRCEAHRPGSRMNTGLQPDALIASSSSQVPIRTLPMHVCHNASRA